MTVPTHAISPSMPIVGSGIASASAVAHGYYTTNGTNGTISANGPGANTHDYIIGVNDIKSTTGSVINIDQLAAMMSVIQQRLLILTPNFEQLEKYSMLRDLYNEYRAMEQLLGVTNDIK